MHSSSTSGAHPGPAAKASLVGSRFPGYVYDHAPRNVYWETTLACDLACKHCRADAIRYRDPLELTFEEGKALLEEIKRLGSMVILTGGDPMKRPDLFDLIAYARRGQGPRVDHPLHDPDRARRPGPLRLYRCGRRDRHGRGSGDVVEEGLRLRAGRTDIRRRDLVLGQEASGDGVAVGDHAVGLRDERQEPLMVPAILHALETGADQPDRCWSCDRPRTPW